MRELLVSLLVAVFLSLVSPNAVDNSDSLNRPIAQVVPAAAPTQVIVPHAFAVADMPRDTLFSVDMLLPSAYPVIQAAPDQPVPAEPRSRRRQPPQLAMVSESGSEVVSRTVQRKALRREVEPNHVAVTTWAHGSLA